MPLTVHTAPQSRVYVHLCESIGIRIDSHIDEGGMG